MDSSSTPDLSVLQRKILHAFFDREKDFFLTGGAALVGFFLQHRRTDDLDLFTLDGDAFRRGPFILQEIADELEASLVSRVEAPGFRRYVLETDSEAVVVDLVHERVVQIHESKLDLEGVRVDPPDEILVNKLTALASRGEIRDLVDVWRLDEEGHSVEEALEGALAKDGGCTPATLAWVLSEIEISENAALPGGVSATKLRKYLQSLVRRLRTAALPSS